MVRCMWTGSPQPPPASRMIGSRHTVRMSTATSASSGRGRFASVTHLTQPSEPPLRYTALKPACSASRAMIGLSATGATTRSSPAMRSFNVGKAGSLMCVRGSLRCRRGRIQMSAKPSGSAPMLYLYHGTTSVCAVKARLTLAEKNLPWEGEVLDLQRGDQHRPEYEKLNPNHVVPTLVHDGR